MIDVDIRVWSLQNTSQHLSIGAYSQCYISIALPSHYFTFAITEKIDDSLQDIIVGIAAEFNDRTEKLDSIILSCMSLEWACRKILSNERFDEWHEIVSEVLAWAVNRQFEANADLCELYGFGDE